MFDFYLLFLFLFFNRSVFVETGLALAWLAAVCRGSLMYLRVFLYEEWMSGKNQSAEHTLRRSSTTNVDLIGSKGRRLDKNVI